jgi:hypothetical protein
MNPGFPDSTATLSAPPAASIYSADELRAFLKEVAWGHSVRMRIVADSLDIRDDASAAYAIKCASIEMSAMTRALEKLLALKEAEHAG